jgi:hypothetical protein
MMWKVRDLQGNMAESMQYYGRMVEKLKAYMLREQRRPGMRKQIRPNQTYRSRAMRLS